VSKLPIRACALQDQVISDDISSFRMQAVTWHLHNCTETSSIRHCSARKPCVTVNTYELQNRSLLTMTYVSPANINSKSPLSKRNTTLPLLHVFTLTRALRNTYSFESVIFLSELLRSSSLSIVRYSRNYKTWRFGKWICFRPKVWGEDTYQLGSLDRANLNHGSRRLPPTPEDGNRSSFRNVVFYIS
jgi:hypothetical protein